MIEKTIVLGVMAPDLIEQGYDDEEGHLQRDADAISRLVVRGFLTKRESDAARKRLIKRLRPLSHD